MPRHTADITVKLRKRQLVHAGCRNLANTVVNEGLHMSYIVSNVLLAQSVIIKIVLPLASLGFLGVGL